MAPSRLIAGFIGPLLAAIGIAMLLNRDQFSVLVAQAARDQGLIFLTGILSLLAGIAIVRAHNIWSGDWRTAVTVLGWLAILGGLTRMWLPQYAAPIAEKLGGNPVAFVIGGIVNVALGAFLSYKAYGAASEKG
jgi:uncharacterized membrane protein